MLREDVQILAAKVDQQTKSNQNKDDNFWSTSHSTIKASLPPSPSPSASQDISIIAQVQNWFSPLLISQLCLC
jgi:hypothetical protein